MIELSEFITQLRKELETSAQKAAAKKKGIVFQLEPIEVELTMAATRKADGKLSFKIFSVGAEAGGGVSSTETQKVTLKLTPQNADGSAGPVLLKDAGGPGSGS